MSGTVRGCHGVHTVPDVSAPTGMCAAHAQGHTRMLWDHRAQGPHLGAQRSQAPSPHGPGEHSSDSRRNGSASSGWRVRLTGWPGARVPRVEGP